MILRLLILSLALPAAVLGQAPASLRLEAVKDSAAVIAGRHRGYAAYPARALETLGAEVVVGPADARVVIFGDTLSFETLSPFFRAAGRIEHLAMTPYMERGVLYLPDQVFTEWLPTRYPDRLSFQGGVLRLLRQNSRPGTIAEAPAPADRRAQRRVVVLDAGHGGKDPGKIGPNGVREKDVTLAVALRLAALLREAGFEVHLTRTTDTLIALADRPRLANRWKAGRPASVFISLHANSGVRGSKGFETFFLSDARTEDERRVAEMENAVVRFEDNGHEPEPGDDVGRILSGLKNDFYMHASNDLAEAMQRRMAAFHPGQNRGVKQAGFRVLVGALMPAVLVEIAFLSDREEAALLARSSFQQKVAWALAEAINQFFQTHEHVLASEDD